MPTGNTERCILSEENTIFDITQAQELFGGSLIDEEDKEHLVETTIGDIAAMITGILAIDEIAIEERKRGLAVLGVQDAESKIQSAIKRLHVAAAAD